MSQPASTRRSGTLNLYLAAPSTPGTGETFARFRLCRGFLDDLNRVLPIRLRIQLEAEIAQGRQCGDLAASGAGPGLRWEFAEG